MKNKETHTCKNMTNMSLDLRLLCSDCKTNMLKLLFIT